MASQASTQGEEYEDLSVAEQVLVSVENVLSLGSPRLPAVDWDQRLKHFTEASIEKTKQAGDGALEAVGLAKEQGERGGGSGQHGQGEEEVNTMQAEMNKLASGTVDTVTEHVESFRKVVEQTQRVVPASLDSSMESLGEVGEEAVRLAHETTKAGNELIFKTGEALVTGATEVLERHLGKQEKIDVNSLAKLENAIFFSEPNLGNVSAVDQVLEE
mmetsp:Transcript_17307/g.42279  ORF Transcript_17307/g.42279 Transcript_17307/m.42279 type:complete len:216 (+) Transcript_17307:47-694(+)